MGFDFSKMPKERPSGGFDKLVPGKHKVEVISNEIKTGQNGRYMRLTMKVVDGTNRIWTNLTESDKPFAQYIVRKFLEATGLTNFEGTFDLDDLAKLVNGRKLIVDVVVNDKGYGDVTFTDSDGFYPFDYLDVDATRVPQKEQDAKELDKEIEAAIVEEVEDEEF